MAEPGYPLCRQTVTLYHPDPDAGTVTRTVVRGAFLDRRVRMVHTEQGQNRASAFLLIIPERSARRDADYTLAPGDRVLPGEGQAVAWADWDAFVPALVPRAVCGPQGLAGFALPPGSGRLVDPQRQRRPQPDQLRRKPWTPTRR